MTTRRPPRCTEHRKKYRAGCAACQAWANWYNANRKRRVGAGTWGRMVDIEVVRTHIASLRAEGMRIVDIAEAADLAQGAITKILYSTQHRQVTPGTAGAIMAVRPTPRPPDGEYLVDAVGTRRRIRALCRIGWTYGEIGSYLGVNACNVGALTERSRVLRETKERVERVYDKLSMTPGPSKITARRAERAGWPSPLAWDDDEIDNPDAGPDGLPDQFDGRVDEATVGRVVAGERIVLARTVDRAAAIYRLWQDGWPDLEIGRRIGKKPDYVRKYRARHGWTSTGHVVGNTRRRAAPIAPRPSDMEAARRKERIRACVAMGLGTREIAARLGFTYRQVRYWRNMVLAEDAQRQAGAVA